jgi:hypothetical protein
MNTRYKPQESVLDFKERIKAMMRARETTQERVARLADRPCIRKPTDYGYYPPPRISGRSRR